MMIDVTKFREKIEMGRERAARYKHDSEPMSRKYDYLEVREVI
jgi:hypothetical protein